MAKSYVGNTSISFDDLRRAVKKLNPDVVFIEPGDNYDPSGGKICGLYIGGRHIMSVMRWPAIPRVNIHNGDLNPSHRGWEKSLRMLVAKRVVRQDDIERELGVKLKPFSEPLIIHNDNSYHGDTKQCQ